MKTTKTQIWTDIDVLGLSARPRNALRLRGINAVEQLAKLSDRDLLKFRSICKKSCAEIRSKVIDYLLGRLQKKTIHDIELDDAVITLRTPALMEALAETAKPFGDGAVAALQLAVYALEHHETMICARCAKYEEVYRSDRCNDGIQHSDQYIAGMPCCGKFVLKKEAEYEE